MSQMAKHLKAEHAQGVPSRLMQPVGGRPPSQPRVPIHLMVPHSTNTPGSGASSSSSSRQPTPSNSLVTPSNQSESVLHSRVQAAPTHVVPRYDVYGFALQQPPAGVAARQLRTVDRGPEVPEHWAKSPTHKGNSVMAASMLSGLGQPTEAPPQSVSYISRSEMQQARRRAQRPDASYDIDGDGFVSQRDYSIAKKHDARANQVSLHGTNPNPDPNPDPDRNPHPPQVSSYGTGGALNEAELRAAIAEDMHRLDTQLPSDELQASIKGNGAHASLSQEPDMRAARRGPKLTADRRDVTALWNRSSVQVRARVRVRVRVRVRARVT